MIQNDQSNLPHITYKSINKPLDYDPNKEAKNNFFEMLADFRPDTPDFLIDLFKGCLNFKTKLRPTFQAVN